MRFESERELEDLLFENWWKLHDADRLPVVPEPTGDGTWLMRQVRIPGASNASAGGDGFADLVQISSLATDDWVSATITVVELKITPVSVDDIFQALRYASSISSAVSPLRLWDSVGARPTWISVGAVVAGTGASPKALEATKILRTIDTCDPRVPKFPLRIANVSLCPIGGIGLLEATPDDSCPESHGDLSGRLLSPLAGHLEGMHSTLVDSPFYPWAKDPKDSVATLASVEAALGRGGIS